MRLINLTKYKNYIDDIKSLLNVLKTVDHDTWKDIDDKMTLFDSCSACRDQEKICEVYDDIICGSILRSISKKNMEYTIETSIDDRKEAVFFKIRIPNKFYGYESGENKATVILEEYIDVLKQIDVLKRIK